jgi:Predicted double-stranded RNA/RNA-DNA hybrid binding protein
LTMPKKKFYAYQVGEEKGVTDNWNECAEIVGGQSGAKYKSFESEDEARRWLEAGADYAVRHIAREPGIYFDAGTGGGNGVEISVTDSRGHGLLHRVLPEDELSACGHHLLERGRTNNFGELLACKYALQIALETGMEKIFGDSKLVLDFWSKGLVKKSMDSETISLADEVAKLRKKFERLGGRLARISGGANPADLGFHKN